VPVTRLSTVPAEPATLLYGGAVLVLILLLGATRRLGLAFLVSAFPATLAHELMHLGIALITNGRPSALRLLPRRSARGYTLGSVTCSNVRWYNGLFIGLAPLALLPLAAELFRWRVRLGPAADVSEAAWAYGIASLVLAALPSWQDLRIALISSWLLLAVAAGAAVYVIGALPRAA
jgi:hypothetical protein